jgi:23S rRNA (pseudouridine1915-N3)-methyltransferase
MNKDISKAHSIGEKEAKQSYTNSFSPFLKTKIYSICLDVKAKQLDTFEFAKLFDKNISFFIGGAYGFEPSFISKCDKSISLSSLTFSHKLAKTVLYEQIYRALCIKNNHPYHKN